MTGGTATLPEVLPTAVQINAWTGTETAQGELDPRADRWYARGGLPRSQKPLLLRESVDPKKWADPAVGYGVLLPERPDASAADKAAGLDAPQAVRDLLAARPGTVMLRWDPKLPTHLIRRYLPDGSTRTPGIGTTRFGTGPAELPRYVAIIGGPDVVPWSVQYEFGTRHAVGRIPLTGEALNRYVDALINDWPGADVDVRAPLMWTVDRPGDITADMRAVIANPLETALTDPRLPRFQHLTDGAANMAQLVAALTTARPALVVTSSHGATVGSANQMAATLGLPVDREHVTVSLDELDAAMPGGAIWHAQACCSAGSEGPSKYLGLLATGTSAATTCATAAELGSTVAPAAIRLLGRKRPVRAVIGHVEPTFSWTLRVAETGQGLGHHIVAALSDHLHIARRPVGLAFDEYHSVVGTLHTQYTGGVEQVNQTGDTTLRPWLTRLRLTAIDRQSMVLLGDPTVTLPPLDGAP